MAQSQGLTVKDEPNAGALLLLARVGAWCMVVRPGYVPFIMSAGAFDALPSATEEGERRARYHMELIEG